MVGPWGPTETEGRFSYVRDPCCVSRRTFGLADAQVPHSYVGTEERCAAVSDRAGRRPRDLAPPSLWAGDHRAYLLDMPKVARARRTYDTLNADYVREVKVASET
jgi:hypothetical protein